MYHGRELAFLQVLREHGVDGAEVDRIFAGVDMDESGSLHYMEFLAATIEARGYIEVCVVSVFCLFGFVCLIRHVHLPILRDAKYLLFLVSCVITQDDVVIK